MASNIVGGEFLRQAKALERKLITLGPRVERKVIGQAVTKSLAPVRNESRRILRKDKVTGTLVRSIGNKTKRYSDGVIVGMIGARRGFATVLRAPQPDGLNTKRASRLRKHDPTHILHLIEFGAKPHAIRAGTRTSAKAVANLNDPWRQGALKIWRGTVWHPGVKARAPLGGAFNAKHGEMLAVYRNAVARGVTLEAAKEGITTF